MLTKHKNVKHDSKRKSSSYFQNVLQAAKY